MLEVSEVRLDRVVDNLSYASFSMKGWTKSRFQVLSNLGCSMILWSVNVSPITYQYKLPHSTCLIWKKTNLKTTKQLEKPHKCLNSQAKNSLYKRAEIITNNQLKVFTAGEPSLTEDKSQTSNLPSILSLSRKSLHLFPSWEHSEESLRCFSDTNHWVFFHLTETISLHEDLSKESKYI